MRSNLHLLVVATAISLPASAAKLTLTVEGITSTLEADRIHFAGESNVLTAKENVRMLRDHQVLLADDLRVVFIDRKAVSLARSKGGQNRAMMISDTINLGRATLYCADQIDYYPFEGRAVLTGNAEIFTANQYFESHQFEYFEQTRTLTGGTEGSRVQLSNSPPPFSSFCDEQAGQFIRPANDVSGRTDSKIQSKVVSVTANQDTDAFAEGLSDLMILFPWTRVFKFFVR